MTKYGRIGSLQAAKGRGKQLLKILLEAAEIVSHIKGCRQYTVGLDLENSDIVHVIEIWDSMANHRESLDNQKVKELIGNARPLLSEEQVEGIEMNVIGGHHSFI